MTLDDSLIGDPFYPALKKFLIDSTGLDYYAQRDDDLSRRIRTRFKALGLKDCQSYLVRLAESSAAGSETDTLVAELTIGETYFFRYREQFEGLRSVVFPELIRKNRERRRLRIWSAGCATGAEPYSLSILLRREFGAQIAGWDVNIVGTDINREFLAKAHQNEFPAWAFRGVPEETLGQCFTCKGDRWSVRPEYRESVFFQYHNLTRHPFPSAVDGLVDFDLIMCRNVMIYFNESTIVRLLGQFMQSLGHGGWLLVGHAESNVEWFRDFRRVSVPGAVMYQKSEMAPVELPFSTLLDVSQFSATVSSVDADVPNLDTLRHLMDRGAWAAADETCTALLAVNPLDARVHFHQALVVEQLGSPDRSEQLLRRALYLDPTLVLAHYHLGLLCARRDDRAAAVRSFNNVLRALDEVPADFVFPNADGLTARNLQELTGMNLEMLGSA